VSASPDPELSPGLEQLVEVHDAERAALNEAFAVGSAECVVTSSRIADLAAAQKAAYRRVSAARGQLTRAQKDGDTAKIADARSRLDELSAAADRISGTSVHEMQALLEGQLGNLGATLDQLGRAWAAGDAVTDVMIARGPGAGK
jgi:hypothetical protein